MSMGFPHRRIYSALKILPVLLLLTGCDTPEGYNRETTTSSGEMIRSTEFEVMYTPYTNAFKFMKHFTHIEKSERSGNEVSKQRYYQRGRRTMLTEWVKIGFFGLHLTETVLDESRIEKYLKRYSITKVETFRAGDTYAIFGVSGDCAVISFATKLKVGIYDNDQGNPDHWGLYVGCNGLTVSPSEFVNRIALASDEDIALYRKIRGADLSAQTNSRGSSPTENRTISGAALTAYEEYREAGKFPDFRAFVWDTDSGAWGRAWGLHTADDALASANSECRRRNGQCTNYAVGDTVIYGKSDAIQAAAVRQYYKRVTDNPKNRMIDGEKLTAGEIRQYLSGRKVRGETFGGLKYIVELSASGSMSARIIGLDANVKKTDSGRWWTENGKQSGWFCRQFTFFFQGKTSCQSIVKKDEQFNLYTADGNLVSQLFRE